ncbi:hypothetical protein GCM10009624_11970 [Gordonia sinesedis]
MKSRFDQRTLAVLASETGAVPLILLGLISPTFIQPGGRVGLTIIGIYTVVSIAVTVWAGRLSDVQFAVLSFGGMLGIAGSAYLITDDGSAHAVLVLLAAIPALAAMGSPPAVVVGFVAVAAVLAGTVVTARASSLTALFVGGGAVLMAILVPTYMVTTLRRSLSTLLEQQAKLSVTDPLTKALNRRGLLGEATALFRSATESGRQVGFLVADVDYFKRINDARGHSAGDAILIDITRVLRDSAPPGALVVRTGGEEFLVLTTVADRIELATIGGRIRRTVAIETDVTLSIGGVSAPLLETGANAACGVQTVLDILFGRADQCLYNAKQLGRNRVETASLATLRWGEAVSPDEMAEAIAPRLAPQHSRRSAARPMPTTSADKAPSRAEPVGFDASAPVPVPSPNPPPIHGGAMFEILHPERDELRISQLRSSGRYELVDAWAHAAPELNMLDRLEHVDPTTPVPERLDVDNENVREKHSRYVVFPWRATIVRMPESEIHYRLKTARNRFLVTAEEQRMWSQATIAVAGLSVGSAAVIACSLTGARRFHMADPDELSPTNLNRMIGSVCDLGRSKLELATRRVLESDPYSTVTSFPLGYGPSVADEFLGISTGTPVSLVIEEIDDVAMKIDMRRRARDAGIPVLSATDIGDNVILDVERYDLDPKYPIFHGRGENFTPGDATDPEQRLRMATAIVGDALTPRMAYSASQIGRSVASWPQLGSTAMMAGAFTAATARNLVCGRHVESGRYRLDVEETLFGNAQVADGWNELSADAMATMLDALSVPTDPR